MLITDISTIPYREVMDLSLLGELFHPMLFGDQVSARYSIAHARVAAGKKTLPHTLLRSSEAYYILQGKGIMHIGSESRHLSEGQLVYIPPGQVQFIENAGDDELIFLAIVDPLWQSGDEILGTPEQKKSPHMNQFMEEAIREAESGLAEGGIPIGSVLVRDEKIIGRGHNRRVQEGDPMVHAEIDCLRNAGRIGSYAGCTLYSTLMPCYLCAGAVVQFRIPEVIVGESRTFEGAAAFMRSHGVRVLDLDHQRCIEMMRSFITKYPDLWNEDIGTT
ncbi:deaminase [Methanospirillum sp.]|uniref:deaminase n=1 Tax=Methanospirillum sp. TaxID=45200 RepID=UPI00345DB659